MSIQLLNDMYSGIRTFKHDGAGADSALGAGAADVPGVGADGVDGCDGDGCEGDEGVGGDGCDGVGVDGGEGCGGVGVVDGAAGVCAGAGADAGGSFTKLHVSFKKVRVAGLGNKTSKQKSLVPLTTLQQAGEILSALPDEKADVNSLMHPLTPLKFEKQVNGFCNCANPNWTFILITNTATRITCTNAEFFIAARFGVL
ncbi:hypothetical protein HS088_TW04G01552 [Tripterygium wilfordii]|uniref:Uncharacterized protein n=1 Tax=Tripterygium wilfordii TaxID=458696 RepID=A0A7J7DT80_TRIWF|nr:hypothetical protein HS088_TW04G01552 [Tripterygium wilfordii]